MTAIVKRELEALFKLLEIDGKDDIEMLLSDIEKEALFEAKEGLSVKEAESIETIKDVPLQKYETACSKIMVRYYANHKKNYNEEQKEIFLTFLLTNKLQRELEKN